MGKWIFMYMHLERYRTKNLTVKNLEHFQLNYSQVHSHLNIVQYQLYRFLLRYLLESIFHQDIDCVILDILN